MKLLSITKIKETKAAIIAQANDVFFWIGSDFKNYGTDIPSDKGTKADSIEVYEQEKDGTFKDIFASLSSDLDKLCLTQGQIIDIVKNHSDILLKDGWYNFLLFKVGNEFFVARVYRSGDGWSVYVNRFSSGHVWDAGCRRRVVVPQLSALGSIPIDPETPSTFENRIESLERDMDKIKKFLII